MKNNWERIVFTDCIEPVRVDRARQVKSREYLPSGKYPVVDQGQGIIAGWTDNEAAVIRERLPYVVFGDHTRAFKYIDFPFALGADGTKLLKPYEIFNPRYFYFQLLSFNIPSRGYSRHYGFLKEKKFSLPTLPEQKKIAAVLLRIQQAIEMQEDIIQSLSDLKKSTMQHLFTRGLRGEKTKMTEIGESPESWEIQPLSELRVFLQYGTSKLCSLKEKGNPVLRIPNVIGGAINTNEVKYAEFSQKEQDKLILQNGDVLFVRTNGQRRLVGRTAVYEGNPTNALFASYLIRTRLVADKLRPEFFQQYTESLHGTGNLSGRSTPAADGKFNINTKIIDAVPVPVPEVTEQDEIIRVHRNVQSAIYLHELNKIALQDLFKTTLNKLMTGEIQVKDLDIDMKEVES